MPVFSQQSKDVLAQLDDRLQKVLLTAIEIVDFKLYEGFRDKARQNEMYRTGASKLKWPQSKHNRRPSAAVDLAPYPLESIQNLSDDDRARFYYVAGVIVTIGRACGIQIRWGGDWDGDDIFSDNDFDDLMHFELRET